MPYINTREGYPPLGFLIYLPLYYVFRGSKEAFFYALRALNGAFFILGPGVFDYIDGDDTQWEHKPMEQLARDGQLMAYRHTSFWQCMDTLRDKRLLEELWQRGNAPWKLWED